MLRNRTVMLVFMTFRTPISENEKNPKILARFWRRSAEAMVKRPEIIFFKPNKDQYSF